MIGEGRVRGNTCFSGSLKLQWIKEYRKIIIYPLPFSLLSNLSSPLTQNIAAVQRTSVGIDRFSKSVGLGESRKREQLQRISAS